MTTFKDTLPDLAEPLSDRCVQALQRAYSANSERFDEQLGDDRLSFGVQVWRNSWHLLEVGLADLDGVSTSRPEGSLVIAAGSIRIHTYKVGNTEEQDIDNVRISGTATKDRIVTVNSEQLQLFATEASPVNLNNLVLAHAGNPFDGLCAVWVGAPTQDDAGPSWHWVERVFLIPPDEVHRGAEPLPEGPVIPYADMPGADFDLSLKPEADEEESGSDES